MQKMKKMFLWLEKKKNDSMDSNEDVEEIRPRGKCVPPREVGHAGF